MNGVNFVCIFLGVLCLFGLIGTIVALVYVDYQYESKIGAYFDNAEDCITPECILIQLNAGYDAIKSSGLTKDDYGAWIFKKPNNKMEFQYQHLDAIIERAEAVQNWVDKVYSNGTQAETMKDVYTEKMDNLRKYITGEGYRSDWIANDSWWLKYHFFLSVFGFWIILILLILTILFFALPLSGTDF
jgi:hypothetical protein